MYSYPSINFSFTNNPHFFKIEEQSKIPKIKKVIFNDPATIVIWEDGSEKTVVKCQSADSYSEERGLAMCICKKALGNKSNFNNVFHKWVYEREENKELSSEILKKLKKEKTSDFLSIQDFLDFLEKD